MFFFFRENEKREYSSYRRKKNVKIGAEDAERDTKGRNVKKW